MNNRLIANGTLTSQESLLLDKQNITVNSLNEKLAELQEQLNDIREESSKNEIPYLKATGEIFPNTQIYFGKYSKPIQNNMRSVKIYMDHGEIVSIPL